MRLRSRVLAISALALCGLAATAATKPSISKPEIPLTFEANRGQAPAPGIFVAQSAAGTILLTKTGATFLSASASEKALAKLHLGDQCAAPVAEAATGGVANYYTSPDPKRWLSGIPLYTRVRYTSCYPGVDAVFHGRGSQLEYDFEISPEAAASEISFRFDGAEKIEIANDGSLMVQAGGKIGLRLLPPVAYQAKNGEQQPVEVSYRLEPDNAVSFRLGDYDHAQTLVIDPVVAYAAYLPANVATVTSAAIDPSGNLIVTGTSGSNVGVVKIDPSGTQILYSTTIGTANTTGAYSDSATAFAVDPNGNAYVTGETSAPDFPFTSGSITTCNPNCAGGYIAKFAPNGSLVYATPLSGGRFVPNSLAVDSGGYTYLTGSGDSSLATVNAFQPTCTNPCSGAFYAKLDPSGTNYVFASFFSGPGPINNSIRPIGIALDANGNIFLAGETNADPPLVNPWQSGTGGVFVAKFAPDGKTLLFSTRFGSSAPFTAITPGGEVVTKLVVGPDGTVFVVGTTQSQDFPFSLNSPQHEIQRNSYESGFFDIFAFAIDPTLTKLLYSDYLGEGYPLSAAVGANNHLYVSGMTLTNPLPLQNPVVSDISTGGFYVEIDPAGNFVSFSQFGGHVAVDIPTAIAVDSSNAVYLVGSGSYMWGTPSAVTYFGFPGQQDPVQVGPNIGSTTSSSFAKIASVNGAQVSLNTIGPYLTLRNAGSADLHISSVQVGGGLSKRYGNCGAMVTAATSCILTVTDSTTFRLPER